MVAGCTPGSATILIPIGATALAASGIPAAIDCLRVAVHDAGVSSASTDVAFVVRRPMHTRTRSLLDGDARATQAAGKNYPP
ncbi:MAG: hypothetical protein AB7H93_04525 [Vicinamibacterales bacterium]